MLRHRNDAGVELGLDFVPIDTTVDGWQTPNAAAIHSTLRVC